MYSRSDRSRYCTIYVDLRRSRMFENKMPQDHYEDRLNSQLENRSALEKVTELVETRLMDCGWKDQVKLTLRKTIEEDIKRAWTVDELLQIITPKARSMVPDTVKRELLHELEKIFTSLDKIHHNKSL